MRTWSIGMLLYVSGFLHAQSWCPPGAHWIFDTGSPWSVSNTLISYAGDTVIDGFQAQRMDKTMRIVQLFGNDTLIETSQPNFFTRTNGDLVWEWNGGNWDTLYWFSAVPGDEWQPFWPYGEVCPDHVWHVVDTSTFIVDGLPLRSVLAELRENGTPTGQQAVFKERIGGAGGIGFPGLPPCGGIYECFCSFLCYQDQDISFPSIGGTCDFTLDAAQARPEDGWHGPYPNPGSNRVFMDIPCDAMPMEALFLNDMGQLVFRTPLIPGDAMDVSALNPGHYIVRILDRNGSWIEQASWIKL